MMHSLFMGVDIGTSSVRAALFDENGFEKALASEECSISTAAGGRAEMDPDEIVKMTFRVIKECAEASFAEKCRIEAVGFSCQMHSLMAIDESGAPLSSLMVWADTRAKDEARSIEANYDIGALYEATGCRVQHPLYPLSKILWMKRHEPELFRRAEKLISIKEYLFYILYGEFLTDRTIASCQGYFNIHTQAWDHDILSRLLGISKERLGEIVECTHTMRGFKKEYEALLELPCETPFVIGSGDGILANIGSGALGKSSMATTIGTSGAVRITVDKPLLDKNQKTWCYSFTKDKWVAGGAINNGGLVLKWLRDEFRQQFEADAAYRGCGIYKLFDEFAAEIPAGSNGLLFLPYLTGERSPDWNTDVRGMLFGLSYEHGRKHLVRASMEGVMYRLFSVYEVLSGMRAQPQRILASGGYTKSPLWLQMQADLFGKDVSVTGAGEVSALGAAYVAMCATGAVSYGHLLPAMEPVRVFHPNAENTAVYKNAYARAMELYNKLYGE